MTMWEPRRAATPARLTRGADPCHDLCMRRDIRWSFRLVLILACGLLQGCTATLYFDARPSPDVLAAMKRWCEKDAGLRWFGPQPQGLDLWVLGHLERDPMGRRDLGDIEPSSYPISSIHDLLSSGLARTVNLNLAPKAEAAYDFGPRRGEPNGIYRFELRPGDDPQCASYHAYATAARIEPELGGRCIVYRYVGPFDGQPRPAMMLDFTDPAVQSEGFFRSGQVLWVGGAVRATSVRYAAVRTGSIHSGTWGVNTCERPDNRSISEQLRGVPAF
jgi:hypothetical protein